MHSFSDFLVEMNISQARQLLGLTGDFDEPKLKKAYRSASMKAHPDRGGSTADMQNVNSAYEVLKTVAAEQDKQTQQQDTWDKYHEMGWMVRDDLKKNLDIEAFKRFFSSTFNEEFAGSITQSAPDDKRMRVGAPYSAMVAAEWVNHDRSRVFTLTISVRLSDLFSAGGLAAPGTTYNMTVQTFAYIDKRKVKITARDFTHSAKKSVFSQPETVFPSNKIVRKKKTKFKKSDMLSALRAELKAEDHGDYFFIPVKDDRFLCVFRSTMMRQGRWNINGIWMRKGNYSMTRDKSIQDKFVSFEESEETLKLFKDISKMSPKRAISFIQDEYQKTVANYI